MGDNVIDLIDNDFVRSAHLPLVQNFYIFSFQYQDATAEEEGEFDEEEGEEEA